VRFSILMVVQGRGRLGYDYRYGLASLLYATVASSSRDYCDFLHDVGFEVRGRHFRLFTFSDLEPLADKKWTADGLLYEAGDTFRWQVSSPVSEFIREVAHGLFQIQNPHIGPMPVHFADVAIDPDPPAPSHAVFRTLSPITMSVHDTQYRKHYLTPDEDWSGPVTENLRNKVRALTGEVNHGFVTVEFDQEFIRRRESHGRHVTKLCAYKDIRIRAVAAPFSVTGDSELIAIGYDAGFGDANPAGFGMVEYMQVAGRERDDNRRADR